VKRRVPNYMLICLYGVLWGGGVVAHLLWQRTPPGAQWTAPAFLACAAALVLLGASSGRVWLAAAGAGGFLAEVGGVQVALLFGPYSYSGVLQPQLAGVPVVMACAWVILLAYVKNRLALLEMNRWVAVVAGAVWMTAIDLLIDPVATLGLGYWVWHAPGPYYGVPFSNFTGWLVVSAALLAAGWNVRAEGLGPRWVGLSVIVFFGVLAMAHRLWWPVAVAGALCAWDAWLARARREGPPEGQAETGTAEKSET
jgi:uncharacterized membrane protein